MESYNRQPFETGFFHLFNAFVIIPVMCSSGLFFSLLSTIYSYRIPSLFYIAFTTEGLSACFQPKQLWREKLRAFLYRFYVNIVSVSLGKFLAVGLLGHVMAMSDVLKNYTSLHSDRQGMKAVIALLPRQGFSEFLIVSIFQNFSQSNKFAVIAYCSFNLHSLISKDAEQGNAFGNIDNV